MIQDENGDETTRTKFLAEQLEQMDQNWGELEKMVQNRDKMLKNELEELRFNNDCAVVEQILANHEVQIQAVQFLEDPTEAEEILEKHAETIKELDATQERVCIFKMYILSIFPLYQICFRRSTRCRS